MRLSVTVLGWELLAIDLGNSDTASDDDPGDCTSYPLGFVANHELPEGSGLPFHEGWE